MKALSSLALSAVATLSLTSSAVALPVTISDNYYGATPTSAAFANKDIVGATDQFDIKNMTVDVTGGILSVSIKTSYFDNVGVLKTEFGDLFISSDGWSPFGSAPYTGDNHSNGETWEYALAFDNHGEAYSGNNTGYSMIGASGSASLFTVQNAAEIELSNHPNLIHRADQESQFHASLGNTSLATGSWSIGALSHGYSNLLITLSLVGTPLEHITDFGFHFGFSCGNDVIEGNYTTEVPEPASLLLLGSACGLMGLKRRRSLSS